MRKLSEVGRPVTTSLICEGQARSRGSTIQRALSTVLESHIHSAAPCVRKTRRDQISQLGCRISSISSFASSSFLFGWLLDYPLGRLPQSCSYRVLRGLFSPSESLYTYGQPGLTCNGYVQVSDPSLRQTIRSRDSQLMRFVTKLAIDRLARNVQGSYDHINVLLK